MRADFPMPLEDGVSYRGFNSPKSLGGNSYFVEHSGGNWLIDSPKYLPQLVEQFERRGGSPHIFFSPPPAVGGAQQNAPRFSRRGGIHPRGVAAPPPPPRLVRRVC